MELFLRSKYSSSVTNVTRVALSGELAAWVAIVNRAPDFNETLCDGVTASRDQEATSSHLPSSIRTPTLFHLFLPSFSRLLLDAAPALFYRLSPTPNPAWTEDACLSFGGQ